MSKYRGYRLSRQFHEYLPKKQIVADKYVAPSTVLLLHYFVYKCKDSNYYDPA